MIRAVRVLVSLGAAATLCCSLAPLRAAPGDERVVRSFTAGTSLGSVGTTFSDAGEDKEEEGPQAIASGDDGKLFLLDQLNGRILAFNPQTPDVAPQTLTLPPGVKPTDLVVKGSDIYIWDGKVHALEPLGSANAPTRGLTETRSAEPVDDATVTAFAQLGSTDAQVEVPGESTRAVSNRRNDLARQVVATQGGGRVVVDVTLADKGTAVLDVKGRNPGGPSTKIRIKVHDQLGTVAFLDIDSAGRMYVLAENIPTNIRDAAFVFVARFSLNGTLEGVYEVPLSSTTVSRRCIAVSPQGDVYFLKTQRNAVDIVGLGFRSTPKASLIEFSRYRPNAAAVAWVDTKGISMAVGPLTRDRIIQAALGYEGVQWTVTPPNYGNQTEVCSGFNGRIRVPMYMIGKENETVRGVPYCWGLPGLRPPVHGSDAARHAGGQRLHQGRCPLRHGRGGLFVLRQRHLGFVDPFHDRCHPGHRAAIVESLGSQTGRRARQAGLACRAVHGIHAESRSAGDGSLAGRLRGPRVPQHLPAVVVALARLHSCTLPRVGGLRLRH